MEKQSREQRKNHKAEFTVIVVPHFLAQPEEDGTNSETAILVNFKKKLVLIAGTSYAGEIKKSIFTVMNYLLPKQNVMPMHPSVYAKLLGEKIEKHNANIWLINTGWSGGPYGVGERMKIIYTRAMLNEALAGNLDDVDVTIDPIFGVKIPIAVNGVPTEVLVPQNTWSDKNDYTTMAKKLASMFIENFKKFEEGTAIEIIEAGPKL